MKLQTPTSKLQKMFKERASKRLENSGSLPEPAPYPEAQETALELNETSTSGEKRHPFDLEERTARFGEAIVKFSKKIPRSPTNNRLIDQLVGCGTSVGANYCEANESTSKRDFRFIIGRCRKEAKETKFFLRMVVASEATLAAEARTLFIEAKELHLIFCSIYRNTA